MEIKDMPLTHCAEGRCKDVFYRDAHGPCKNFIRLIREGKTPHDCYYYNPIKDYQTIPKNKKSGKGLKRKKKMAQRKKK